MLIANNLHKVYINGTKELRVLKGINLSIEDGKIVGIVGPSGAGKSTLLHILGGLDMPTQGRVYLDEVDIYKLPDRHLARLRNEKIGFVFQFYHLFSEFNVLENVMLPALCSRKRMNGKVRENSRSLLNSVGLLERSSHMPNQLSGGEQQRVAVARALINEPKILFCDEPTGNLDSRCGWEIINMIRALNKERGTTVVLVTHNEEIARIADTILHLKDGVLTY